MATIDTNKCKWCGNWLVKAKERTTLKNLEVLFCTECDGRALNFTELEQEPDPEEEA